MTVQELLDELRKLDPNTLVKVDDGAFYGVV